MLKISSFSKFPDSSHSCLVTGGLGFIGCNLVDRLLSEGCRVTVLDNAARKGVHFNRQWLQERHGKRFRWINGDVRDAKTVASAVKGVSVIYHLAAQVAVTTSVEEPREDFEINALGTLNVLEAARKLKPSPVIVFTSTNKVYGGLEGVKMVKAGTRYKLDGWSSGIPESFPLDFHSPYGCSKGCADQYIHDYHRIYNFPSVVFRMSCIYGQRQFGNEDQGWVAHFVINALKGGKMTIYGDGCQVRDILYIDDLVEALLTAVKRIKLTSGRVYNIGGGPSNTLAVWTEFGPMLSRLLGKKIKPQFKEWRPGDQKVYISNIQKAGREMGWTPGISVKEGVRRLVEWGHEAVAISR